MLLQPVDRETQDSYTFTVIHRLNICVCVIVNRKTTCIRGKKGEKTCSVEKAVLSERILELEAKLGGSCAKLQSNGKKKNVGRQRG